MENFVIIIGNLGDDPKLSYTSGGIPVANFNVATSDKWSDKRNGEKKEHVEWHRVEVWKNLGTACAEHLKKGSRVYVRGSLHTTSWEPTPGEKRYATVIRAKKVTFL